MAEWKTLPHGTHLLQQNEGVSMSVYAFQGHPAVNITIANVGDVSGEDVVADIDLNLEELHGLAKALQAAYDRTVKNG